MNILSKHSGFTILELIISMTLFGLIMISVFDSVASIGFTRIQSTQRISLLEELYSFSEKFTTTIKEGGTIDYEEYWGRMVMGTGIIDGHYMTGTLFGNYGSGWVPLTSWLNDWWDTPYKCKSRDGIGMWTGGCLNDYNTDNNGSHAGKYQRYGQYRLQFTDYNGNRNGDNGNEDGIDGIVWDEDDVEIGDGPEVISNPMVELYLINMLKKERTYFRIQYSLDPDRISGATCDTNTWIGSGCLGKIQLLKMSGKDIGYNHNAGTGWNNEAFDGNIDTWVCHPDWRCSGKSVVNPYGNVSFWNASDWVDLFPDYINVKSLKFDIYPLKNPWYAWKAQDDLATPGFISPFLHPYVKVEVSLWFAWKRRTIIRNDDPTITISTTLNLEDYTN